MKLISAFLQPLVKYQTVLADTTLQCVSAVAFGYIAGAWQLDKFDQVW